MMKPVTKNTFFIVLMNISFSYLNVLGEEIWRYSSKEGDGTLFTTRHSIVVEHLATNGSVDWCYPAECTLNNHSFNSAIILCLKPGFHLIGPITSGPGNQIARHINVILSPFYYEWYLAYDRELYVNNDTKEEFRLWIMDPKHMSDAENNGTALFPSLYSRQLSGIFFRLGQKPFVRAKVGYRFISWDQLQIFNQSFSVIHGCWQLSTDSVNNHQATVWIDGQSVALHDRFIRRSSLQLLKTKFHFSVSNNEVILRGRNQNKLPVIVQDPCAPYVALFISSKCLFTQDNFATTVELKVSSSLLMQSEATVKLAVFSGGNLVVLLQSGRVLVFNGTTQAWSDPSGLSQVGLSDLASQNKCFEGAHDKVMMSVVVGWLNKNNGSQIYFSKNSGISFQQLYLPTLSFTVVSVQHGEIHCLFPIATFLLNATGYGSQQEGFLVCFCLIFAMTWVLSLSISSMLILEQCLVVFRLHGSNMLFLQYNFAEDIWVEKEFELLSFNQDLPYSFSFIPPSTQFVIASSKKMFVFGRLNETGSVFKLKRQENLTDFILDDNETIVSVITGGHGDFVVHLSNNQMFYGRAFVGHVVEVFAGVEPTSKLTAMFDVFGSVLLITSEGENVQRRKLPLENEVLNAVHPHTSCPYLQFTTSISAELHFIDKGDETKVWAQLIYPTAAPNGIQLEISSDDVLQITSEENMEYYPGIVTVNKTFTFKYNLRNGTSVPKSAYKSATVAVQLFPNIGELTCENTFQVLHMYVGCQPLKNIIIRNCTSQANDGPAPLLSEVTGHDEECRLSGSTSASFKLVVDLYKGDQFVEEVHADYVVWEETGRTDYGYTATMSEAGCLSEAQTWRKLTGNNSGDLNSIWTQNTYRSCFESASNGKAFDGSQPYEILNSTGISQLVFQGSGTYQFQLRVVGTHLSFCELTTRFSLDVSDSEGKDYFPLLVSVLVVTLTSNVLLYISFKHYTKETLHRHMENEEEQQRLQELKGLFSTIQQGEGPTGQRRSTSTGHNVMRFSGTAMLMCNKVPQECLADFDSVLKSPGPSRDSL